MLFGCNVYISSSFIVVSFHNVIPPLFYSIVFTIINKDRKVKDNIKSINRDILKTYGRLARHPGIKIKRVKM